MRFKVQTIYENVDQKWLDWYLKRLANSNALPGSREIVRDLCERGKAVFKSEDPTSQVSGTTTYEIER